MDLPVEACVSFAAQKRNSTITGQIHGHSGTAIHPHLLNSLALACRTLRMLGSKITKGRINSDITCYQIYPNIIKIDGSRNKVRGEVECEY